MSTSPNVPQLDIAALEAEINSLSPEEIQKQLLDIRTKQKVQQAKHMNTPEQKARQKAYMKKKSEMTKLMTLKAKELGIYDSIQEQAKENAAQIMANNAVEAAPEEHEEDAVEA